MALLGIKFPELAGLREDIAAQQHVEYVCYLRHFGPNVGKSWSTLGNGRAQKVLSLHAWSTPNTGTSFQGLLLSTGIVRALLFSLAAGIALRLCQPIQSPSAVLTRSPAELKDSWCAPQHVLQPSHTLDGHLCEYICIHSQMQRSMSMWVASEAEM